MPLRVPVTCWSFARTLIQVFLISVVCSVRAELWINEVLFNPPGTNNVPHQYIELRGTPNLLLSNVFFVAVEGDTNGNPGSVENVFDLTGVRVGGNGFIVILQNSNLYTPNFAATVLKNTNGPGFGSGADSSIRHRGKNGQVSLQTASTTFLLIRADISPDTGEDTDADNDGVLDGVATNWEVLDSVGVLDNDGLGDIVYGRINFRRNESPGNGAMANGTVVAIDFTAGYVARLKNTTNSTSDDWMAADKLTGVEPRWALAPGAIYPPTLRRGPLNSIGIPNFKGPKLPGVILRPLLRETSEGGAPARYSIALNVPARKGLTVELTAPPGTELSIDQGRSYGGSRVVKLSGAGARTVLVRQADDDVIGPLQRIGEVTHRVIASGDPGRYPIDGTIVSPALVQVMDDDRAILSELKVNPPGAEDAPFEFVEIRGKPNALLEHVRFLALVGSSSLNPGVATVIDLSGRRLGSDGLLLITASGHPYLPANETTLVIAPQFGQAGGALPNGAVTFLLVQSTNAIAEGEDLDAGDNGKLERMPADAVILDSIAWTDGSGNGTVYSSAVIKMKSGTPDAATRFSTDDRPQLADAWFAGNLAGTNGESVQYDEARVTTNYPYGTGLSPGVINRTAPQISTLPAFSSVINDPTTPLVRFFVSDKEIPATALVVAVDSGNPDVVPNTRLRLGGLGNERTLAIDPIGVGYATITLTVTDGQMSSSRSFAYAASADAIGGGRFHSGASDGSTAFALDAQWMFVGDDENQRIRLYSRSNSGPPVVSFDLSPFLALNDFYDDGTPKEVDIEASTHVGNRIYWLGSHSHAGDAEIRTNRARVFATDLSGKGTNATLSYAGRYQYLKYDLLNWDSHGEHGKPNFYYGLNDSSMPGVDPKDTNGIGFNIEGLAMAPSSTNTAYLGFRAPLVPPTNRVYALVVPVTNFASLAISEAEGGFSRFGPPIELNLGGRGIRSIEALGTNYLIVAGPPGPATGVPPSDFKFFTWTGNPADVPQQRSAVLSGLNIEGIVELPKLPWTSNSMVQVLSDNGTQVYYNDGIEAKHLPIREFKKFRTDWIRLGSAVTPQPFIRTAIKEEPAGMQIVWHSFAGVTYRAQSKAALSDAEWTDIEGDVTATSATSAKQVVATPGRKFFRVIVIPKL